MAKVKAKYETIFIVNPNLNEEETAEVVAKFRTLIEENATIDKVDEWGKRKLAYEINDEAEGHYVIFNFDSEPAFPAEFERVAGITDGVLRTLVVKN